MSTLVVSNISDGTTTVGASYVTNGSAKAWVNFNGTGTVAIRDSLNVSSITDLGTGQYESNFSSSFNADNYAVASHASGPYGTGSNYILTYSDTTSSGSFTTSSFKMQTQDGTGIVDSPRLTASLNGDIA